MATELRDALTAANASALVQKRIDPFIMERVRRYSPLVDAIPDEPWDSTDFYFDNVSAFPAGGFVTDGGAVSQSTSTYGQDSVKLKLLQTVGGVTGFARAVTRGIAGDLLAREKFYAARRQVWDIETAICWGNATATSDAIPSATDGGAPQFDGLDTLVSTFSGASQNAIDEAGATFTLGIINNLQDLVAVKNGAPVEGSGWAWIMSTTMRSSLAALLTKQQRYLGEMELKAGLKVLTYNDIPILTSSFLACRSQQMGTVTTSTGHTANGGVIADATTYHYGVSAVLSGFGEIACSADASRTTGSAGGNDNYVTLSFSAPTQVEGSTTLLFKVYRGAGATTKTLLGVVPARDTTGTAVTAIIDNGAALLTNSQANTGTTVAAAYIGGNSGQTQPGTSDENIYLVPLDRDYMVRPYTRHLEPLDVAPTVSSPDTLPFALASDTALAVRSTKYLARAWRVQPNLAP